MSLVVFIPGGSCGSFTSIEAPSDSKFEISIFCRFLNSGSFVKLRFSTFILNSCCLHSEYDPIDGFITLNFSSIFYNKLIRSQKLTLFPLKILFDSCLRSVTFNEPRIYIPFFKFICETELRLRMASISLKFTLSLVPVPN